MARGASRLLSDLGCCCICCFLPGMIIFMAANAPYGHWEAVPAMVVSTTYCGASRRRTLETVDHGQYYEPIVYSSESTVLLKDDSLAHHDRDDEDDSDDETYDSHAGRRPSASTYTFLNTSDLRSRTRRHLQQHYPSVQRRTQMGDSGAHSGGSYVGIKDGYYAGSHHHSAPSSSNSNTDQYSVTYAFTTRDGQPITTTTDYCTNPVPPVGGTEMILYNPASPSSGAVSEGYYEALHISGFIMFGYGLMSIAVIGSAVYLLIKSMKGSSSNTTYNNNAYSTNNSNAYDYPANKNDSYVT